MITGFDSNLVLNKEEREERVLDLHFNQKNYRQIAQDVKMSPRYRRNCKHYKARKRETRSQIACCTSL
jgi:hypothetical protein